MCECRPRAGRQARVTITILTVAVAVLWGLAIGLRGHVDDQAIILLTGAGVASAVALALAVAVGVMRKRDEIATDAASAAYEAELAANRVVQSALIEALRQVTEDVALLPAAVPEDNRATRPLRVVEPPGA